MYALAAAAQRRHLPPIRRDLLYFPAVFLLVCALAGCMPSGEKDINTEFFKDKTEFIERTESLRAGMRKKAVFEKLGIHPDRFEKMSARDVQMHMYGNAQVQGTPEQLEAFRKRIQAYEGYSLPYSEIKSSSSLGFGTMRVARTGHDLRLVLIFRNGRLVQSATEGTHEVKLEEEQYLWDALLRRGLGAAF